MNSLIEIAIIAGVGLVALLILGLIFARLYKRASKETAFVRTGFGGEKVVMNGGALVLPVLHETISVNMNTLRLAVQRSNEQALITKDRMRVDVLAEFYVRVQPSADAIASAAQTLGLRTMNPMELKELVEGKFVDALRSVAAELTMTELHEQRTHFVQKVQQVSSEDLLKNGLELETVSLTGLDQTAMEHFNPSNAFDAEGLTRLTQEIELRKKLRNDIEQDTQVQIRTKNLEAQRRNLEIARDEEYAQLEQEREIANRRAEQSADVARQEAEKLREAEGAKITSQQQIDQARIEADRLVAQQRIAMEQEVAEREISKARVIETQDIEKAKAIELSEQDRNIAVAEKSRAESEAKAEADRALALAVQAEEQVKTVRDREAADRQKIIELIEASKEAEREAIAIRVAAEAEKVAASDQAEALREQARGQADKTRIEAEGQAEAIRVAAEASRVHYEVEAAGQHALNTAANLLSPEQVALQIKLKLLENLDRIIAESVKPMENIDSIKIVQVEGLNGGAAAGAGAANGAGGGNLSDQVVNSALRYRAQAPLVDQLLAEVGLSGADLNGLTGALRTPGERPAADDVAVTAASDEADGADAKA
ncbi:MAG: flotillin domain-containing protein [Candidatus Brevundimonas colombiensis]|uniref:Flotillin domain-containing protein n=1 Tax=Candidatus Brevundimonas colombiensis TaxID=3121376 RepID=A0AAJ6BKQ7_9CAUL|nr:flotillin domain-containing protein [Brevundimonas sp.]WEK38751.1 MAG: flotillin domain-containing protein [Brevundimonas sp.]